MSTLWSSRGSALPCARADAPIRGFVLCGRRRGAPLNLNVGPHQRRSNSIRGIRLKEAAQSIVVYAKNKRRVSAFYQRALDLRPVEETPSHDLLRGRGMELVIHAIPRKFATHIEIAKPPRVREETPFKPVFVVKDLEEVRVAVATTGGSLAPSNAAWRYNGYLVLDGCDPEGNVVQFRQPDA